MSRLARVFRIDEISHQPDDQIPWWNLVQIIFKNLANDLKEYGKGYSERNLLRMARLANEFSSDEITTQPVAKIPWATFDLIMQKSKSHEEMLYYINETHKNGWSRAMVLNQISMKLYERSLIEPDTTKIIKSDDLSNELFKDTYVFDF
ncbi:MAG: DUF1016 N-terminal domain-containing protein, partial [Acholeplasmatales bacterium]|nr:DUF1016 N-terminal domain-containing protein [Acholeplasmatales bacterium]